MLLLRSLLIYLLYLLYLLALHQLLIVYLLFLLCLLLIVLLLRRHLLIIQDPSLECLGFSPMNHIFVLLCPFLLKYLIVVLALPLYLLDLLVILLLHLLSLVLNLVCFLVSLENYMIHHLSHRSLLHAPESSHLFFRMLVKQGLVRLGMFLLMVPVLEILLHGIIILLFGFLHLVMLY